METVQELGHAEETPVVLITPPKNLTEIKTAIKSSRSPFVNNKIGIPQRYRCKITQETQHHNQAVAAIKAGRSVFITGCTGSGKTHLTAVLLCRWAADNIIQSKLGDFYQPLGWPCFISFPELKLEIKKSWDEKENFWGKNEGKIIDHYTSTPLLALDDLGAEKISDWSKEVLYLLIDRRYRNYKPTIITSNLSHKEIAERLDERIASRISEMGIVLDLGKKDRRVEKR